jgi:hypothetical protein
MKSSAFVLGATVSLSGALLSCSTSKAVPPRSLAPSLTPVPSSLRVIANSPGEIMQVYTVAGQQVKIGKTLRMNNLTVVPPAAGQLPGEYRRALRRYQQQVALSRLTKATPVQVHAARRQMLAAWAAVPAGPFATTPHVGVAQVRRYSDRKTGHHPQPVAGQPVAGGNAAGTAPRAPTKEVTSTA